MNAVLRPCGDFRTSYRADTTLFATRSERTLVVVGLALLCMAPLLFGRYGLNQFIQIGCMAIAALGLNLLTGYTGQISLGHAAFFGVGAFASTYISNRFGVPPALSIPLGGLVATMFGMVFGVPAARIKGLYLAIATLAAQYILEDFFARATWFTGGVAGAHAAPVSLFGFVLNNESRYFYFVLAWVVVLFLYASNLARSRTGRAFVAVRDHHVSAEMMGIPVVRYRILAFGISSFYAGVGGALLGHYLSFVSTESINILLSVQFIAMIIIGGLASVMGSLLGAAFIVLLPEVLEFAVSVLKSAGWIESRVILDGLNYLREALIGLVIVVFLIFQPHGLAHMVGNLRRRWRAFPFTL